MYNNNHNHHKGVFYSIKEGRLLHLAYLETKQLLVSQICILTIVEK